MKIDLNDVQQTKEIRLEEKKLEAGWFGKVFGTGSNASNNIAGIILLGFLFTILISWFIDPLNSKNLIEMVIPVITLTLGYLFGKQS